MNWRGTADAPRTHKAKPTTAAARAHINTARKYSRAGKLPSQLKQPRSYRTRSDLLPTTAGYRLILNATAQCKLKPFGAVRPTSGRYQLGQLRTLPPDCALACPTWP